MHMYIYIHIQLCVYVYIYTYAYIYIYICSSTEAVADLKAQIQAGDAKLEDLAAQRKTVQARRESSGT